MKEKTMMYFTDWDPFATRSELKGVEVGHDIEVRGRIVGTDREDS